MTPEDYRAEMTTGRIGRLDLDGICPYTGEDDDGSLRRPTEEELDVMFRAKAKEERVDARRNDVWGAPEEYVDDCGQDIGDL